MRFADSPVGHTVVIGTWRTRVVSFKFPAVSNGYEAARLGDGPRGPAVSSPALTSGAARIVKAGQLQQQPVQGLAALGVERRE
jgi:hypothetical protein